MKKRRNKRTDEELVHASEHLRYEIQMLFGTARAMAETHWPEQDNEMSWAMKNALVEAFAIHVRILLGFLYSENPKPDDVVADDYFDDPNQWRRVRPKQSEHLSSVNYRVGKEVAHLTYARIGITKEAKQWPFIDIANEVGAALEKFVSVVPCSRLSQTFLSLLSERPH